MELINGNCLAELKSLKENSVDSIVTDPPYELDFMNKHWDSTGIAFNKEVWQECFRVLKPGGHLLAFGGTRTQHRMVCAIEDAGFEIRDSVVWMYSSGFPKSNNVSKGIDKSKGAVREVVGKSDKSRNKNTSTSITNFAIGEVLLTTPSTPEAKTWNGWGSALKPAHEDICLARKPLSEPTIAKNVLKHGTGGINIDGSRVGTEEIMVNGTSNDNMFKGKFKNKVENPQRTGRFPANLIHDGSEEVVKLFPNVKSKGPGSNGKNGLGKNVYGKMKIDGINKQGDILDFGSASRFFYAAKVSKSERNNGCVGLEEKKYRTHGDINIDITGKSHNTTGYHAAISQNNHPTLKPQSLLRYLITLITPPKGIVLDPFMGSGSTGIAAKALGFDFVGIELDKDYFKIAETRINNWSEELYQKEVKKEEIAEREELKQNNLFTE